MIKNNEIETNKKTLYVFLDVDGVLNNSGAFKLNKDTIYVLSHGNLICYEYLIDKLEEKYNIKIILSSSWRCYKTGLNKPSKHSKKYKGLNFIDKTKKWYGNNRRDEILEYCKAHNISLKNILVIDDELIKDDRIKQIRPFCCDALRFKDVFNYLEKENYNYENQS